MGAQMFYLYTIRRQKTLFGDIIKHMNNHTITHETLQQRLNHVPLEYLSDVADFLELLKFKIVVQSGTHQKHVRRLGGYEGQIIIADDFDETPEGFEEYL